MSSEKCPSDKTPRWASSWVHFLSSAPSLWRLENKKPPQCFFTRSQKNQKTNAAGRRSASFCCFLHENAVLRRCNGSSPQTAFICRPAGGEEERCCVFSSRWKINFYSCATDCFSAAGEEEEEEEEGEEALEFIKCSIVDRIQFVSIPENELSRRMEVMEDDGGDGGWWRWWRMMEMMKVCRTLCLIKFHLHTPFTLTSLSNVWCFCSSRKIFTSKFVSFCDQILPFWFPDLNEPLWKVSSLPSVHSERIWTIIYISVIRLLASSWHRGASSTLTNLYKTLPCRTSAVGCRVFLSPEVLF